jgi:hypothetical protein
MQEPGSHTAGNYRIYQIFNGFFLSAINPIDTLQIGRGRNSRLKKPVDFIGKSI